jgi:Ca-activated chloride channel family protein
MVQPTILLTPSKSAIPAAGGVLEIMVRVQAPDQPGESQHKITPKRLALVVDRSGSMDGQPLTEALKCVLHIAERMTAADQMAVVVYDDKVDTLVAMAPMRSCSRTDRRTAACRKLMPLLSTARNGWPRGSAPPQWVWGAALTKT